MDTPNNPMTEYMTGLWAETNPSAGQDAVTSSSETDDAPESPTSALTAAIRNVQATLTGVQNALDLLNQTLAPPPGQKEQDIEQGDPVTHRTHHTPTEPDDAVGSPVSPPAEVGEPKMESDAPSDTEIGDPLADFVNQYGNHIPEDGQTQQQFIDEQLKEVPYDAWAAIAHLYIKKGAFPASRVEGWPSINIK